MRSIKVIIMILFFNFIFVCLSGCDSSIDSDNSEFNEDGFRIYYVSDDNYQIYSDEYDISSSDIVDVINEILVELKKGSYNKADNPAIPSSIVASTFKLNDQILVLNFDENYNKLSGLEEVLRRASIVRTFCQFNEIKYVKINVNSKPLEIDGETIGNMNEDTFIDNIGIDAAYTTSYDANVYFTNSYGSKLKKLCVTLISDGTKSIEELAVLRLIEGPEKIGYYDTLSRNVKINRIVVHDKKCYIDFNEAFLEKVKGVSDEVRIYCVVNTLTELNTVSKVLFTVNGQKIDEYVGDVYLGNFIERNYELNEEKE